MNINNFKPTKKNKFEVVSGKLLIADPFSLGYHEDIEDMIDEAKCSINRKNPVAYFPHGALYYTLSSDGVGTDCTVGIYREKDSIELIINDYLISPEELDKLKDKFKEHKKNYSDFKSFLIECVGYVKIVDAESWHKLKNPIFDASVDVCCLLIGDFEKYYLNEANWKFRYLEDTPPEKKAKWEKDDKKRTRNIYNKQVLKIPNGFYTAEHVLDEEKLILKLLDR